MVEPGPSKHLSFQQPEEESEVNETEKMKMTIMMMMKLNFKSVNACGVSAMAKKMIYG